MFDFIKGIFDTCVNYVKGICCRVYGYVGDYIRDTVEGNVLNGIFRVGIVLVIGAILISVLPLIWLSTLLFVVPAILIVGYNEAKENTKEHYANLRKQRKQKKATV